jgi:hypothetical protein
MDVALVSRSARLDVPIRSRCSHTSYKGVTEKQM